MAKHPAGCWGWYRSEGSGWSPPSWPAVLGDLAAGDAVLPPPILAASGMSVGTAGSWRSKALLLPAARRSESRWVCTSGNGRPGREERRKTLSKRLYIPGSGKMPFPW